MLPDHGSLGSYHDIKAVSESLNCTIACILWVNPDSSI